MTTLRYSKVGALVATGALLLGSGLLLAPTAPAQAAQARAGQQVQPGGRTSGTKVVVATAGEPSETSAIGKTSQDEQTCDRSRKRLWVEGEGWIVRRVTVCR